MSGFEHVRILLLSDIHANLQALEACLDAAPPYDKIVNLGDVVGYGGSPNEVTRTCRKVAWLSVRGNHDKVCTGIETAEYFNTAAAMAAFWTRQTLTPENLQWLRELPEGPLTNQEVPGVQFVHGSPLDEDEYMISTVDAAQVLEIVQVPVTFFGHSHIQGVFFANRQDNLREMRPTTGAFRRAGAESHTIHLEAESRYLVNPGSVGQPRDGDWRAAFAVYDSNQHAVTFLRVPYDVEAAQQRIRDAMLPERLAVRLNEGR